MKKIVSLALTAILALATAFAFSGCNNQSEKITVAIPNDTTNEARALLLLEDLGYITLKDDASITATILDIEENPYNIEFKEVEAAQLPNVLSDVDYAVINSNYAIEAGLNPTKDALLFRKNIAKKFSKPLDLAAASSCTIDGRRKFPTEERSVPHGIHSKRMCPAGRNQCPHAAVLRSDRSVIPHTPDRRGIPPVRLAGSGPSAADPAIPRHGDSPVSNPGDAAGSRI